MGADCGCVDPGSQPPPSIHPKMVLLNGCESVPCLKGHSSQHQAAHKFYCLCDNLGLPDPLKKLSWFGTQEWSQQNKMTVHFRSFQRAKSKLRTIHFSPNPTSGYRGARNLSWPQCYEPVWRIPVTAWPQCLTEHDTFSHGHWMRPEP